MKTLSIFSFLFAVINFTAPKTVYVCDSRNAVRYHLKENCKGLKNCTYRTLKLTEEQAKKQGKTLCKYEY